MPENTSRVTQVRPAGPDHEVVSVEGGVAGLYRRQPCPTCPWRRDAVGEFPAEAFRHSASTAYDMAPNTFACHQSGTVKPAVCAGFLLRNSDNNLGVRLMLMRGDLDLEQVHDGGTELFSSYREMAVANGGTRATRRSSNAGPTTIEPESTTVTMSTSHPELRADAKAFAASNLKVLANEVLEWRRTGVLHGEKLRQLAVLCRAFTVGNDELQAAEYLVQMAALARVATAPS